MVHSHCLRVKGEQKSGILLSLYITDQKSYEASSKFVIFMESDKECILINLLSKAYMICGNGVFPACQRQRETEATALYFPDKSGTGADGHGENPA